MGHFGILGWHHILFQGVCIFTPDLPGALVMDSGGFGCVLEELLP
jgi:hypothetical protein